MDFRLNQSVSIAYVISIQRVGMHECYEREADSHEADNSVYPVDENSRPQ